MCTKKSDREQGQGLVEYALILVLIAVAVIVLLGTLGDTVGVVFARVSAAMSGQIVGTSGTDIVIQDLDVTISSPDGTNCSLTITNATVMVFEDGEVLDSGSSSLTYSVNGSSSTRSFTISGVSTDIGSLGNYSVPCPAVVTTPLGYSAEFYP